VKKIIFLIFIIIIVIFGVKLLNSKKEEISSIKTAIKPIVSVQLANAKDLMLTNTKNYLSTVKADKSINISSKLNGYIKRIYVREGEEVKKGDLLVEIDDSEIKDTIDALKSSLTAVKKDIEYKESVYARNKELYDIKGLSKEKLDLSYVSVVLAKSKITEIQKKIDSLNNQLKYLKIQAPFDSIVSTVLLKNGDLAVLNKAIIKLNSKKQKLIFTFVGEQIKAGLNVFQDAKQIGKIRTIYDDAQNGLKVAEVQLSTNINAINGESVSVDIVLSQTKGCVVDARAILYNNDKRQLLTYENGKFNFFDIKIITSQDDFVLISPCPKIKFAVSSQSKLSVLPEYKQVTIIESDNE